MVKNLQVVQYDFKLFVLNFKLRVRTKYCNYRIRSRIPNQESRISNLEQIFVAIFARKFQLSSSSWMENFIFFVTRSVTVLNF